MTKIATFLGIESHRLARGICCALAGLCFACGRDGYRPDGGGSNRSSQLFSDSQSSQQALSAMSVAAARQDVVRIDTVRGVTVVNNPRHGQWSASEHWTVREEFRIGGADGPPEILFGGPLLSVSRGPHGNVYVLDLLGNDVTVFDRTGAFVRRLGGSGHGPGELLRPSAMTWDPDDHLWVANGFSGRYTVFDSAGRMIKTVPRPITSIARPQHQMLFDDAGSLIDEGSQRSILNYLRIDTTGVVLESLAAFAPPFRGDHYVRPGADRAIYNYVPVLVWSLATNGLIWSAESGDLRLIQRTIHGDTVRIVETLHRKIGIDPAQRALLARALATAGIDKSEFRLVRPIVAAILVMQDGHVLVAIVEKVGVASRLLDVFDPVGRFLGSIRLPFALSSRAIHSVVGDTLYAVSLDTLDVPYVIRATIQRTRYSRR